jgi:hypothetical protein
VQSTESVSWGNENTTWEMKSRKYRQPNSADFTALDVR